MKNKLKDQAAAGARRIIIQAVAALLIVAGGIGCSHVDARPGGVAVHQVGLVWLKEPGNPKVRQKVIDAVNEFERSIPEVQDAIVGETDRVAGPMTDTSYDVCFILTFKDEAARQRYATHPVHQKAATEVVLPLSEKLLFYRFVGE